MQSIKELLNNFFLNSNLVSFFQISNYILNNLNEEKNNENKQILEEIKQILEEMEEKKEIFSKELKFGENIISKIYWKNLKENLKENSKENLKGNQKGNQKENSKENLKENLKENQKENQISLFDKFQQLKNQKMEKESRLKQLKSTSFFVYDEKEEEKLENLIEKWRDVCQKIMTELLDTAQKNNSNIQMKDVCSAFQIDSKLVFPNEYI